MDTNSGEKCPDRKRRGPTISFPELKEKYSKPANKKTSSNFNTQRSRNAALNTKMTQLTKENNAHMLVLQAFKNEVVYSNHIKNYGSIATTFLNSKLGHLVAISWTKYIDEINQKGERDPTPIQLEEILSRIQAEVCKKLDTFAKQVIKNHCPTSCIEPDLNSEQPVPTAEPTGKKNTFGRPKTLQVTPM